MEHRGDKSEARGLEGRVFFWRELRRDTLGQLSSEELISFMKRHCYPSIRQVEESDIWKQLIMFLHNLRVTVTN